MPLPWTRPNPVMLAPMQGLTNRALRAVFGRTVHPDVLFTEFVRVRPKSPTPVTQSDFHEALSRAGDIPLVVQIIGSADEGVVEAAQELVARGVQHLNVNMGCPFGRMTSVLAGGGMFKRPETVEPMLAKLRTLVPGSLSVKTRTGIDDERQILPLLTAFENAGVDFLAVHARTVDQKYKGAANHAMTRQIVAATSLPVIANGDIWTAQDAAAVLTQSGAAGLMLGRGAVADPLLFSRIRGTAPECPKGALRKHELAAHLLKLLLAYQEVFSGDKQILSKLMQTVAQIRDPDQAKWLKSIKKQRRVDRLVLALQEASARGATAR